MVTNSVKSAELYERMATARANAQLLRLQARVLDQVNQKNDGRDGMSIVKKLASDLSNLEPSESLAIAIGILKGMDGLSVAQARRVLKETDALLDQSAFLDCASTSFQQAAAELNLMESTSK